MKRLMFILCIVAALAVSAPLMATPVAISIDFLGSGGTLQHTGSDWNSDGLGVWITQMAVHYYDNSNNYQTALFPVYTDGGLTPGYLTFDTATGAISIVGYVDALTDLTPIIFHPPFIQGPPTLLTGTVTGFSFLPSANLLMLSGIDTKNDILLADLSSYGFAPGEQFGFFGTSIGFHLNDGLYAALSTDVTNSVVPEPTSLILLGSGLIGAFLLKRKA